MARPVLNEKINTSRILARHGKTGFAILSANRSDRDSDYNETATARLLKDIQSKGYRYIPVYGGYVGTDGVEDDYEPSFIVFPYRAGHSVMASSEPELEDFEVFEDYMLSLCGKYLQDSILIVRPGEPPCYFDRTGKIVSSTSSSRLVANDPRQAFFTSYKPKTEVDKERDMEVARLRRRYRKEKPDMTFDEFISKELKLGRRFTMDIQFECRKDLFTAPAPTSYGELIRRRCSGEILEL